MFLRVFATLAMVCIAAFPAIAEPTNKTAPAPTLQIGDVAPAIPEVQWMEGDEVEQYEADHTYVLYFWTTWSTDSVETLPRLDALAQQYRGNNLSVVALTSSGPGNEVDSINAKVKELTDTEVATNVRFGWTERDSLNEHFLKPAALTQLPCCLVVGPSGTVAFYGTPDDLEYVAPRVCEGTWRGQEDAAALAAANATLMKLLGDPNGSQATEQLQQVGRDFPHFRNKLLFAMAQATSLLKQEQFAELETLANDQLAAWTETKDYRALAVLGGFLLNPSLQSSGSLQAKGESLIDQALQAAPKTPNAIAFLASQYLNVQQPEKAQALINKAIEDSEDESEREMLKLLLQRFESTPDRPAPQGTTR